MTRATFARHRSVLNRHIETCTTKDFFDEATLTLEGDPVLLSKVIEVQYGPKRIAIDQQACRAIHGSHSDPAIIVHREQGSFLQLFLYTVGEGYNEPAIIRFADGAKEIVPVAAMECDLSDLRSSVVDENGLKLKVTSARPFEVIWQTSNLGIEREIHMGSFAADESGQDFLFDIPAFFGNRLGVCVSSSDDIYSGHEHKHTFFGEVGLASGRYLLKGSRLLPPRTNHAETRVRSLLVDFLTCDDFDEALLNRFDEVTIITDYERAATIAERVLHHRALQTLTAARPGLGCKDADILLLHPDEPIGVPDKMASFLLFADQNSEGFAERLQRTLARLEKDPAVKAVERSWTGATKFYEPQWASADYGIAFSHSTADANRGRATMERLKLTRRSDIGEATFQMAATPFARSLFRV